MNASSFQENQENSAVPTSRADNIKALWSFTERHKRKLFLGILLGFVATGTELATPMMAKSVLDLLGTGKSMTLPIILLTFLLILGTLTS